MKIDFSRGNWTMDGMTYACAWKFDDIRRFVQEDDCIANETDAENPHGYSFVTMLTENTYDSGSTASATCSFESYGAPILLITDELDVDDRGILRYGNYFEVCIWERGVNLWHYTQKEGKPSWVKAMAAMFPLEGNEKYKISATVVGNGINFEVDGRKFFMRVENMYKKVHFGINACEGLNRFYDFEVKEI
ncbi:MAG: hypothetical protein IJC94_01030 [Oscillospiraceae bacterium]|nr:hypothetical protein [Oscillospiraceae bacterium]